MREALGQSGKLGRGVRPIIEGCLQGRSDEGRIVSPCKVFRNDDKTAVAVDAS